MAAPHQPATSGLVFRWGNSPILIVPARGLFRRNTGGSFDATADGLQAHVADLQHVGAVAIGETTPRLQTASPWLSLVVLERPVRVGGRIKKLGIQARPHVALMRSILCAALTLEVLTPDQVPRLDLPAKPKMLDDAPTAEEVAKLLASALGYLRVMIALGAFAGLRMSECRELRVKDIDFVRDEINVRRTLSAKQVTSPKGSKQRRVPMAPKLRAILEPVVVGGTPETPVCLNSNTRVPSRQAVLSSFKRLCRRCGLGREWSFHCGTRHAFASELFRQGVGAETVRRLGGWSSLDVVQRYSHASDDDMHAAVHRL